MVKMRSHGVWHPMPVRDGFLQFANGAGTCWYAYAHERLVDLSTVKILVRDGVVVMIERDGTMMVPPGEVFEAPSELRVERGWLWRGDRFEAPPKVESDPTTKLAAFLRANPDVQALLG